MIDHKYVVFKREDLDEFEDDFEYAASAMRARALPEGETFTLRSSDLFGAQALWAYAGLIQTGVEFVRKTGVEYPPEELVRLETLANDVVDLATEWARVGGRVPT